MAVLIKAIHSQPMSLERIGDCLLNVHPGPWQITQRFWPCSHSAHDSLLSMGLGLLGPLPSWGCMQLSIVKLPICNAYNLHTHQQALSHACAHAWTPCIHLQIGQV